MNKSIKLVGLSLCVLVVGFGLLTGYYNNTNILMATGDTMEIVSEDSTEELGSDFTAHFVGDTAFVLTNNEGDYWNAQGHYTTYNKTGEVVYCIEPEKTAGFVTSTNLLDNTFLTFDIETQNQIINIMEITSEFYLSSNDEVYLVAGQLLVWEAVGYEVVDATENVEVAMEEINTEVSVETNMEEDSTVEGYSTVGQDFVTDSTIIENDEIEEIEENEPIVYMEVYDMSYSTVTINYEVDNEDNLTSDTITFELLQDGQVIDNEVVDISTGYSANNLIIFDNLIYENYYTINAYGDVNGEELLGTIEFQMDTLDLEITDPGSTIIDSNVTSDTLVYDLSLDTHGSDDVEVIDGIESNLVSQTSGFNTRSCMNYTLTESEVTDYKNGIPVPITYDCLEENTVYSLELVFSVEDSDLDYVVTYYSFAVTRQEEPTVNATIETEYLEKNEEIIFNFSSTSDSITEVTIHDTWYDYNETISIGTNSNAGKYNVENEQFKYDDNYEIQTVDVNFGLEYTILADVPYVANFSYTPEEESIEIEFDFYDADNIYENGTLYLYEINDLDNSIQEIEITNTGEITETFTGLSSSSIYQVEFEATYDRGNGSTTDILLSEQVFTSGTIPIVASIQTDSDWYDNGGNITLEIIGSNIEDITEVYIKNGSDVAQWFTVTDGFVDITASLNYCENDCTIELLGFKFEYLGTEYEYDLEPAIKTTYNVYKEEYTITEITTSSSASTIDISFDIEDNDNSHTSGTLYLYEEDDLNTPVQTYDNNQTGNHTVDHTFEQLEQGTTYVITYEAGYDLGGGNTIPVDVLFTETISTATAPTVTGFDTIKNWYSLEEDLIMIISGTDTEKITEAYVHNGDGVFEWHDVENSRVTLTVQDDCPCRPELSKFKYEENGVEYEVELDESVEGYYNVYHDPYEIENLVITPTASTINVTFDIIDEDRTINNYTLYLYEADDLDNEIDSYYSTEKGTQYVDHTFSMLNSETDYIVILEVDYYYGGIQSGVEVAFEQEVTTLEAEETNLVLDATQNVDDPSKIDYSLTGNDGSHGELVISLYKDDNGTSVLIDQSDPFTGDISGSFEHLLFFEDYTVSVEDGDGNILVTQYFLDFQTEGMKPHHNTTCENKNAGDDFSASYVFEATDTRPQIITCFDPEELSYLEVLDLIDVYFDGLVYGKEMSTLSNIYLAPYTPGYNGGGVGGFHTVSDVGNYNVYSLTVYYDHLYPDTAQAQAQSAYFFSHEYGHHVGEIYGLDNCYSYYGQNRNWDQGCKDKNNPDYELRVNENFAEDYASLFGNTASYDYTGAKFDQSSQGLIDNDTADYLTTFMNPETISGTEITDIYIVDDEIFFEVVGLPDNIDGASVDICGYTCATSKEVTGTTIVFDLAEYENITHYTKNKKDILYFSYTIPDEPYRVSSLLYRDATESERFGTTTIEYGYTSTGDNVMSIKKSS